MKSSSLIEAINKVLPQTQCTKCGYDGCLPYAEALASHAADINRCPPGGTAGVDKLSALLGRPAKPIDPTCGLEGPLRVAVIEEAHCIGCTLCIQACPVDAILGANKKMHVVLPDWCTGCDLCLPPCPVDCITMVDVVDNPHWSEDRASTARKRYEQRQQRKTQRPGAAREVEPPSLADKQSAVAAALARARARRQSL